ncbi:CBR-CPB-1 protein [Aphelenchoides fujianensis]|nr:CBR-CPB-1 protein [Aphelenchoides fujianensis]
MPGICTMVPPAYVDGRDEMDVAVLGGKLGKIIPCPPVVLEEEPRKPMWSRKVFVGGLPLQVLDEELVRVFGPFGSFSIFRPSQTTSFQSRCYCFLVFEQAADVERMLGALENTAGGFFADLWAGNRTVKVQVRPFDVLDSKYVPNPQRPVDLRFTVFLGGIARTTRACELAAAFAQFGDVAGVSVDLDPEQLYPRGTARVFFSASTGYTRAMRQKMVQMEANGETKTYEIKPFVYDNYCDNCFSRLIVHQKARYFCAAVSCLSYYCDACWEQMHKGTRSGHRPFNKGALGSGSKAIQRPPSLFVSLEQQMSRPPPMFPH